MSSPASTMPDRSRRTSAIDGGADARAGAWRRAPRGFLLRWCAWFALGVAALFALIALRYTTVATGGGEALASAYTVLMFVSHSATLAAAAAVLFGIVALLLPVPRLVVPLAVTGALALLTLAFVDTYVFQLYRFHIDGSVWNLVTGGAAGETFVFETGTWLKLGLAAAALLALLALLARGAWAWTRACTGRRRGPWLVAGLALFALAHHALHAWADGAGYVPILRRARLLPLHSPLTAKRFLRDMGIEVASVERAPDLADSTLVHPRAPLVFDPPAARHNLLFLVIDSWRADALNPVASPNLARFAQESERFLDHHSGGNATRIGMFSLFYGLPGTYWHDVLSERRGALLVNELERSGYEVAVFRSAPIFSPEFDLTIFAEVEDLRRTSDGDTAWERDADITADFERWLAARQDGRPFFALLFYDSPHKFAYPPDWPLTIQPSLERVDYMSFDNDTDPVPFRNRYSNSVRYVDHLAGRALGELRARGLLDETVVLVTGDHGQEFNDLALNYWGHNSNFARFQTHVPLLLRWPGHEPRSHGHLTSHFDVAPTVLGRLLGCRNPPEDYGVGRDLFDASDRGVLTLASYNRYAAVIPGRTHVVVGSAGEIEAFDRDYRPRELDEEARVALRVTHEARARFRSPATLR